MHINYVAETERLEVVRALKFVDAAILAVDSDETVAKTIELIRPTYFCNGGDVTNESLPIEEIRACEKCNTKLVDGLGKKIQSSRNLTGLTPLKSTHLKVHPVRLKKMSI